MAALDRLIPEPRLVQLDSVEIAEKASTAWQIVRYGDLGRSPIVRALFALRSLPSRWFVAHAAPEVTRSPDAPWATASWLFYIEALDDSRSRFISRFRSASSDDLATRLTYGPYATESIGFVMDRRMLLGVKERVERRKREGGVE